jgi:hypothetical protein
MAQPQSALRDIFQPRPAQENQETPYIDLLRQNKDKDFVNRILNPGIAPAGIPWEGDSTASHQMAAEVDDKGNWYVFPTIVNRGGKLEAMPLYDAMDYAIKTGEYIPMPDKESALDLSENYKTKAMQDFFTRPAYRPQPQQQPSNPSALRALDQAYLMGIGQGPAPARVPKTRGQTTADILGAASLPMSAVPIAGDITGLAADAAMYAAYPEERTMGNYAMSAAGVLPFVPGVAAVRAARGASPLEGTLDMSQAARMQTEYELAHEVAQRNAALPVEQGGLGLPPNNTALDRAAEQGFDTSRPLYHSTNASFDAFKIPDGGFLKFGKGVYTAPNAKYSDRYIRENRDIEAGYKEGANVMPLYARGKIASEKDWEAARQEMMSEGVEPAGYDPQQKEIQRRLKEKGFDGLNMFGNEIIVFDPKNIRSVNAAFDPTKRGSSNLLAGAAGATIGLSALRNIQRDEERQPD